MKHSSKLLTALVHATNTAIGKVDVQEQDNDCGQNTESVINQEHDDVQITVNEQGRKSAVSVSSSVKQYSKNVKQSSSSSTVASQMSSQSTETSHVGVAIAENTAENSERDSENEGNGGSSDSGGN